MFCSRDFQNLLCQVKGKQSIFVDRCLVAVAKRTIKHRVTIPCKRSFDFTWNPPDFMKSAWNPADFMKSGGFHEIPGHSPHLAFIKLKSFCWNTCFYNFGWIWQVISGWNLLDFTGEIRQISQISGWNLPDFTDFMKSAGFHRFHEIRRISWWNPPDFMNVSFCVMIKYRSFYRKTNEGKHRVTIPCKRSFDFTWNPPDFNGFHEIWWISREIWRISWNLADFTWNPVDFMKSLVIAPTLHSSNWRVFAETLAFIILGGFHRWNLGELCWISKVKSTRFQGEIWWISWNPWS